MQITPFTMNHAQKTVRLGFKAKEQTPAQELDEILTENVRINNLSTILATVKGINGVQSSTSNLSQFSSKSKKDARLSIANLVRNMGKQGMNSNQIADALYPEGAITKLNKE
jgi:hypothetical protein